MSYQYLKAASKQATTQNMAEETSENTNQIDVSVVGAFCLLNKTLLSALHLQCKT